ncbi:MAG: sensor histidine kinase [Planctomycetota bacterium]
MDASDRDPRRAGVSTWGALVRYFRRLSLFKKTMLANSAVVLLGAIVGTTITRRLGGTHSGLTLVLAFFTSGAFVTILVNYLAFWNHFRPLLELERALELVRRGEEARRAVQGVRAEAERGLIASVLKVLDRIEDDSLQFSAKLLTYLESERQRIGRELHDDTSQILAAALLALGVAERHLGSEPGSTRQALGSARELIERALDQLKVVIYDLRPAMLDELGLAATLRWYLKARVERPGLEVATQFDVGPERLPIELETALYRVAQEALANAVRHSGARRVEVYLEVKPGYAALRVFDDGRGFDLARARGQGLGLLSMRERIELLGGRFNIVTEPDGGTRVYAVVPISETGSPEAAGGPRIGEDSPP